jgi:hypothetical protein
MSESESINWKFGKKKLPGEDWQMKYFNEVQISEQHQRTAAMYAKLVNQLNKEIRELTEKLNASAPDVFYNARS